MKPCFCSDENGGLSVLNIYLFLATAIVSGVAIDVSNLVSNRTNLQVAADSAAHTAIFMREFNDADESKAAALAVASANMPSERFGDVLRTESIQFGDYNATTREFTADENSRNAVLVQADQLIENGNPVSSFLLHLVGFGEWDVRSDSVFETFYPTCLREGFVAEEVVDIQSNNSYFEGFCIHSNAWVEVNINNFFEAGTVVSMPDSDLLVVPKDGLDDKKNEGLENALREGKWHVKILNRMDEIVEGAMTTDEKYSQPYIDVGTPIEITKTTVEPEDFTPNAPHFVTCGGKFTMNAGIYENIVLKSSCKIQFSNGVELHNAVIISEDTSSKSMYAPNNLILGASDDCEAGGGAILISYGTVDVASSLEMHGSQILAAGNVEFSANAAGIRGASIVAGGRIDGTSNMDFAFCGAGMENIYEAAYFRMVE
jgi:Flp pilus assembly protein TadG